MLQRRDCDLADQARRAASSIALNIGEGSQRAGKDRLHLFRVAQGSAAELRVALRVAVAWGHLAPVIFDAAERLLDRVLRLLWGMTRPR